MVGDHKRPNSQITDQFMAPMRSSQGPRSNASYLASTKRLACSLNELHYSYMINTSLKGLLYSYMINISLYFKQIILLIYDKYYTVV